MLIFHVTIDDIAHLVNKCFYSLNVKELSVSVYQRRVLLDRISYNFKNKALSF